MPRTLEPGATYAGRRDDIVPTNISYEREALEYAREKAGGKHLGRYMSRLIYEDRARDEERTRIVRVIVTPQDDAR
jgi:hypothetical protein